ncbi:MAG: O-antigen ligase family protein [Anaerolineaceae bacterium]|nr:O-antigen ligase family protein [Anaerolineaceae bacterium]
MKPAQFRKISRLDDLIRNVTHWREWVEVNQPRLVRFGVIALVVLFSLAVIPLLVSRNMRMAMLALGGIVGLAGVWVLARNPSWGYIFVVPVAMLVPFGISTGTGTSLNGAVLIVAALFALWILGMIVQGEFTVMRSPVVAPALLMIAATLLAFAIGQLPWFLTEHASLGAQLGGVMIYVFAMGCLLTVAHTLTQSALKWMVWVFLALSTVFVIARWQSNSLYALADRFTNGSTGSIFWVWLATLTTGQLLFNRKLHIAVRVWLGVLLAITMYVMLIQGQTWTSGWLPALAGMGVMIWIGWKKLRLPLILVGLTIAVLQFDNIRSAVMVGDNEYSLVTRVEAWKIMLEIIKANPITGVGPANYYNYTYLFKIAGYAVRFNSHSQYIDLLAQTGILGFGLYTWLMVALQKLAWGLLGKTPSGFMRGFIAAAVGAVAGTVLAGFLGDWVIPFVYNVGMEGFRASLIGWMFLGAVAAVDRWLKSGELVKAEPASAEEG